MIEELAGGAEKSPGEIAAAIGESGSAVTQALCKGLADGTFQRVSRGSYRLDPDRE